MRYSITRQSEPAPRDVLAAATIRHIVNGAVVLCITAMGAVAARPAAAQHQADPAKPSTHDTAAERAPQPQPDTASPHQSGVDTQYPDGNRPPDARANHSTRNDTALDGASAAGDDAEVSEGDDPTATAASTDASSTDAPNEHFFAEDSIEEADEEFDEEPFEEMLRAETIESVTGMGELWFNAPVSVSVVHSSDIRAAASTSVEEALRLAPGLLVRQQTNGVFDVHVRGFDSATTNTLLPFPADGSTLVMIDYRIVHCYFAGNTYWDALPISVDDIERIEIIRGPSAALYGPNAVSGVIHLVTTNHVRRKTDQGHAHAVVDTDQGHLASASAALVSTDAWRVRMSLFHEGRERSRSDFYSWAQGERIDDRLLTTVLAPDTLLQDSRALIPNSSRAVQAAGANLYASYQPSERRSVDVDLGLQSSEAMSILVNNFTTPLSTRLSDTQHADLKVREGSLKAQASYLRGKRTTAGVSQWHYDMDVIDAGAEYAFNGETWSLRPKLTARFADYEGPFLGGSNLLRNGAASLAGDLRPLPGLRLFAAVRADKYNHPKQVLLSGQISLTYRVNESTATRLAASTATRSPTMLETFVDTTQANELATIRYVGNEDLPPMRQSTVEIGLRTSLGLFMRVDIELFASYLQDLSTLSFDSLSRDASGTMVSVFRFETLSLRLRQLGGTASFDLNPDRWLSLRLFATIQTTRALQGSDDSTTYIGELAREDTGSMPTAFGGFIANVDVRSWLSVHIGIHGTTRQRFAGLVGEEELAPQFHLNLGVRRRFGEHAEVYATVREALATVEPDYGFGDPVTRRWMLGIRWDRM